MTSTSPQLNGTMIKKLKSEAGAGDSSGAVNTPGTSSEQEHALSAQKEHALMAPFHYLCKSPGKHVRSKLTQAFNEWLRIPDDKMLQIAEIVQMLHNASLMIDDIEDNSELRRGIPVAHHIYGIPRTLNSANYVIFLALEKTLHLGHAEATVVFTTQLIELHRGQGMDIYWRDTVQCPTEEEYRRMVIQKTGGLFGLAVQLMQLFSANKQDFSPLIGKLGLYFQIRDDYANLKSTEYADAKTFAEDLTEGKFSFPIVHAVNETDAKDQLLNILRQKPSSVEVKKYAITLLQESGSLEYTRKTLCDLEKQINDELKNFGPNEHMCHLLTSLRAVYATET